MANTYRNISTGPGSDKVANEVIYDNGGGPLSALDVQSAIDEIIANGGVPPYQQVTDFASLPAAASATGEFRYVLNETGSYLLFNKRKRGWYQSDGAVWNYAGDNTRNATDSFFDNTASGLAATNVQDAIDETEAKTEGSINVHSDVDVLTVAPTLSDLLEFDGANWVPLTQREEGAVKINNIATALLVPDGVTYTIAPTPPLVFSTSTRFPLAISNLYPGQTPQANETTFRPHIFDDINLKWLENPKNLQVHLWRVRLNYTRAATTTNRQIIATLNNPLSGFTLQQAFTMPNGAAFLTFETAFYFLTIADSASIGFGYVLSLRPEGDDITINDLDLTRVSMAVL